MTHKELRAKIDEHIDYGTCGVCDGKCYKEENIPWLALRAVVELAYKVEKFEDVQFWTEEAIEAYKLAMRRTIQAIEKELK